MKRLFTNMWRVTMTLRPNQIHNHTGSVPRIAVTLGTFVLCAAFCAAHEVAAQRPSPIPVVPVERYTLPNGLTVLLSPDHGAPVVAVEVAYHVGSKNERPGRTGFAHLYEHLMFEGSQHIPYGVHFRTVENAGGEVNAETAEDETSYFEILPSTNLAQALWLESDRMGFLLPALDQAKLDAQRKIVKNERRQGVDNRPYGSSEEVLLHALFPSTNPYSWPTIGSMTDLSAASLTDVERFFQTYYGPNNATLAIVGDFTPATAKALVAKYFGKIPTGPSVPRPVVPPVRLPAEQRLVLEDRQTTVPQLTIAWPTVGEDRPDYAALDVLASMLTGDRTSGLTKRLVYQRHLATHVSVQAMTFENAGYFQIHVVPKPAVSLTAIEQVIDSTVAELTHTPPGRGEVDRFKAAIRVGTVFRLAGALERADILAAGQAMHHDPLSYLRIAREKLAVTPAAIERVARRYLGPGRVVLNMIPAGQFAAIAQPAAPYTNVTPAPEVQRNAAPATNVVTSPSHADTDRGRAIEPPADQAKPITFPVAQRRVLANGTVVVVLEDHRLPIVNVAAVLHVSPALEPANQTGLTRIVQEMLEEGTTSHSADQVADAIAALGNSVSPFGFSTITANLTPSLALMADQLLHPAFPDSALARVKSDMLAEIRESVAEPSYLADRIFSATIDGKGHPYARVPTEGGVGSVTRDDVVRFYTQYFCPPNVTFVVTGDITPEQAVRQLNRVFGAWRRGASGDVAVPAPAGVASTAIYLYDRPGSAQSQFVIGSVGPRRDTPDWYAIQLMNTTLGGTHTSRLVYDLREQHGYTYGVRSRFLFRRIPEAGVFSVRTSVVTIKTDSALLQTMQELRTIGTTHPITPDEFAFAKGLATRGLAVQSETMEDRARMLRALVVDNAPLDYYRTLQQQYQAVTLPQAQAATRYIDPARLAIVIVGDRAVLEPKLRAAGVAPIVLVDSIPSPIPPQS